MGHKNITHLLENPSGPNAWKVAMILEELNVPCTYKIIEFPDMRKEAYEPINPKGRVPTIEDPNTDITLWESGAIIEYLRQATQHQLRPRLERVLRSEAVAVLPVNEICRVSGVLERDLQDKEFLVGSKFSYADAAFVMGYAILFLFADRVNLETDFPLLNALLEHIKARPAISKILQDRDAAMKAK